MSRPIMRAGAGETVEYQAETTTVVPLSTACIPNCLQQLLNEWRNVWNVDQRTQPLGWQHFIHQGYWTEPVLPSAVKITNPTCATGHNRWHDCMTHCFLKCISYTQYMRNTLFKYYFIKTIKKTLSDALSTIRLTNSLFDVTFNSNNFSSVTHHELDSLQVKCQCDRLVYTATMCSLDFITYWEKITRLG